MLARALVADPDVLIVDEPTTGLDPRHALEAASRLRALAQSGKLVIAAMHDLTLVPVTPPACSRWIMAGWPATAPSPRR